MPTFAAILLLAGKSTRFGGPEKKVFAELAGRAVWLRSLEAFMARKDVGQIVVAVAAEDRELFDLRYGATLAFVERATVVEGGAERHESVRNALAAVGADCDYVAVHDAARPLVTPAMLERVFAAAVAHGAALLAAPLVDTLKRADAAGFCAATEPRAGRWLAQTPQVFRRELLVAAHANLAHVPPPVTDDAQLVEALGQPVKLVDAEGPNLKITAAADLALAAAILGARSPERPARHHPFADEETW